MNAQKIEKGVRLILEGIGEDVDREGIKDTPARVARMYEEIFYGVGKGPDDILKIVPGEVHDEMVLSKDIPMFSICEHHLLPFYGKAHIAYIPSDGRVVGISKLVRILELYCRRPQLQERLTSQVADTLMEKLKPQGVMVIVEATHQCMTIRGVKKPHSNIVTSVVRGIFRTNSRTRAELLSLIKN